MTILLVRLATSSAIAEPLGLPPVPQERLQADAGVLKNPNFDLMVLEVLEVNDEDKEPLDVAVRIVEVLRGRQWVGRTATAIWRWPNQQDRERYQLTAGTKLLAVVIGSQLRNRTIKIKVVRTYEASLENLETARRNMAPPDPSPWPMTIAVVIGLAMLALAKLLSSAWARNALVAGALAGALATLVLYVDYERRMSHYTTIRLDLPLLVWPAVGAALAIPIGAWWLLFRGKRGGTDDED